MNISKRDTLRAVWYALIPIAVFFLMKLRLEESLLSEEDLNIRYGHVLCYIAEGLFLVAAVYVSLKLTKHICIVISALWCTMIAGVYFFRFIPFDSFLMPLFMDETVTLILFGAYLGCGLIAMVRRNEGD